MTKIASYQLERELAEEREMAEERELAEDSAAATYEWSEEVEREERAEPAKRCPVCLSSNTQPEKDELSKLNSSIFFIVMQLLLR
jgi:hypothetical protein